MARHRLIHPNGIVEARLRRAVGGTPHRRPSPVPPGGRQLAALALVSVVAGGGVTAGVELARADRLQSSPDDAGRAGGGSGPGTAPTADADGDARTPDTPPPAAAAAPVVTPSPAASPPRTTAPAAPLWRGDDASAFRRTPWNTVGTREPWMDGDAVRFAVSGRNQRAELEPAVPEMTEGDELYFAFSVRLDEDFPAEGSSRQVITQWKNDSPGSAPVDLRVWNGRLILHGGHGHPSGPHTFTKDLGPAPVGRWSDVVVRVRFSANPRKGSISAWQDGEQQVRSYRPPGGTLYPGQSSYLKTGLAREPAITRPAEVAFRHWSVGRTLQSVS